LEPVDLVRVDRGTTGTKSITLQRLKGPGNFDPAFLSTLLARPAPAEILFASGANLDILFQGNGISPPSDIILDFMYGIAAFRCWGVKDSREVLQRVYESLYKPLLDAPNLHSADDGTDSADDGGGSDGDDGDDPRDADYKPHASHGHYASIRRGDEMAKAMDNLNEVLMYLNGISPQEAATRWEKRMEQEEEIARKASHNKVKEWMKAVEIGGLQIIVCEDTPS
jgi:hypothetical protein